MYTAVGDSSVEERKVALHNWVLDGNLRQQMHWESKRFEIAQDRDDALQHAKTGTQINDIEARFKRRDEHAQRELARLAHNLEEFERKHGL